MIESILGKLGIRRENKSRTSRDLTDIFIERQCTEYPLQDLDSIQSGVSFLNRTSEDFRFFVRPVNEEHPLQLETYKDLPSLEYFFRNNCNYQLFQIRHADLHSPDWEISQDTGLLSLFFKQKNSDGCYLLGDDEATFVNWSLLYDAYKTNSNDLQINPFDFKDERRGRVILKK